MPIVRGKLDTVKDHAAASASVPERALQTTADQPWPVAHLSSKINDYIDKMPPVWVEGQVLNLKRWQNMYFLTLRDLDKDASIPATLPASAVSQLAEPLAEESRVVIHAKPSWWIKRGSLQLQGDAVQVVGLGDLLRRIEELKQRLAAAGLFAAAHKKPLPFLPKRVGLICANQGDAEHDVINNAKARWAGVEFEIRRVTVQGVKAVPEVSAALADLDSHPDVDVIVIARGGGSLEDLLPFSDEALVRAIFDTQTPVVSAIGHEQDSPLIDLVADYRASTPTDAGKRIVPDAEVEKLQVSRNIQRLSSALERHFSYAAERLTQVRNRPVMTSPAQLLTVPQGEVDYLLQHSGQSLVRILTDADARSRELVASLRALSPQSTLDRGYAVVQFSEGERVGEVIRDSAAVSAGDNLKIRVAAGEFLATARANSIANSSSKDTAKTRPDTATNNQQSSTPKPTAPKTTPKTTKPAGSKKQKQKEDS